MTRNEAITFFEHLIPGNAESAEATRIAIEAMKATDRSKHGHWVVLQNCSNSGVYCSECRTKMFDSYPMKKKLSRFCGHCGAHNDLQVEMR